MSGNSSARKLLAPLIPAYRLALWMREKRLGTTAEPVRRLRFPVISIGNLSTGGTGKTPLTIALAKALTSRGFSVDVLSRGYRRQSKLPARVAIEGPAEEYGDEPLLIAREAGVPVYVAPQRYDAGLLAEGDATAISAFQTDAKTVVHLLDDGFQHRQLARDVDIVLLNRQDWHDSLLPAGNLREPIKAIGRATAVAIPAGDSDFESELKTWGYQGQVWRLRRKMEVPPIDDPASAFCGIARPDQFFAGLESSGLQLAARTAFPDHHRYSSSDVERLLAKAASAGAAAIITTEKDQVRLGKLASSFPESLPLKTARLTVEIDREDQAIEWLITRLTLRPARPPL
jgi:tetraacyldisaccharide 4'-kinase